MGGCLVIAGMAVLSPSLPIRGNAHDLEYQGLLGRIGARFETVTKNGALPLFATCIPEIWLVYLETFVISRRRYHDCRACERDFGGL